MKKLLLLRHAKSNKHTSGIHDFDRPLNDRGLKAATLVGSHIGKKAIMPNLVVSSPAERARQTATLAIKAAGIATDLLFDERIYEASASQLLTVVKQLDEDSSAAILVGHNPGFDDLLSNLTGHVRHMPTAALACIALNVEKWSDVDERGGELKWMITPKDLEEA